MISLLVIFFTELQNFFKGKQKSGCLTILIIIIIEKILKITSLRYQISEIAESIVNKL